MRPVLSVLYEDHCILVIDKPARMPTLSEPGGLYPTVAALLLAQYPALADVAPHAEDAGIVHRLDNDTSGCLLVAKTRGAYAALRAQFDARTVQKEYHALLLGAVPDTLHCTAPIAHHPRKSHRMLVCDTRRVATEQQAQPAETLIECLTRVPIGRGRPSPYTLCRVTIRTGVRHQIRAHCAAAGYPVAGDRVYQNARARKDDTLPLSHHFLHAARLVFRAPSDGRSITVEAPLPQALQSVLQKMGTGPIFSGMKEFVDRDGSLPYTSRICRALCSAFSSSAAWPRLS